MDDTPPTPEDVLRFGNVSGDSVVIGQVGAGSSGVAIGSNITQIIYPAGALPADNPEWEKRHLTLPVEPPGAPILFVGRNEELLKLHHYLDELAAPLRAGQHRGGRMVLVYGAVGVGKRELVRQWLADLRVQPAPIVARTTFLPAELSDQVSDDYYSTHPAWELGWGVHGEQVRQYFPEAFQLGGYPWVSLAVQLAGQSQAIQAALRTGQKWDDALKVDTGSLPVRAVTELLRLASQERRPVVIVLEQAQLCSDDWFIMLKRWEEEIGHSKWPVLLVVEWDHPHHLHAALPAVGTDLRIDWFRKVCIANDYRAGMVEVSPLTRADIDAILAPGLRHFAADLHHLSDGLPAIVQIVLSHWQTLGMATPDRDGRWHVHAGAGNVLPGALYDDLIMAPLAQAAAIAQKLGYEQLEAEHLLEWLKYAVWEGDAFTDDALARAVGWHETEEAWEAFQEILEEALCAGDDNPDGLIEFLEPVSLPYGDNQSHDFCRYRFRPPVVAAILRQRQDLGDRRERGQGFAKALLAAYDPYRDRILTRLAWLYRAIDMPHAAFEYGELASRMAALEREEATLALLVRLVRDTVDERIVVARILRFLSTGHLLLHPNRLIPWCKQALELAESGGDAQIQGVALDWLGMTHAHIGDFPTALEYYARALPKFQFVRDRRGQATTLTNIGAVYFDQGDNQRALQYYSQALPLRQQADDRAGEGTTLNNIGAVYADLGEQHRAIQYYERALTLRSLVGDKAGEATTLHNIGAAYQALHEYQNALEYYELALSLRQRVGDKYGEAATLNNLGRAYSDLGERQRALECLEHALPLIREIGDKVGEATTLHNIGEIHDDQDEKELAIDCIEQALLLYRLVGDKAEAAATQYDLGRIYFLRGDTEQGLQHFGEALVLQHQVGDRWHEASTGYARALALAALGEVAQAIEQLQAVVALDEELGRPELQRDREKLEELLARQAGAG